MEIKYFKPECNSCACSLDKQREAIINAAKAVGMEIDSLIVFAGLENAQKQGVPEVPAVVVDGELVFSGYEPNEKDLTKIFKKLV